MNPSQIVFLFCFFKYKTDYRFIVIVQKLLSWDDATATILILWVMWLYGLYQSLNGGGVLPAALNQLLFNFNTLSHLS